MSSTWTWSGRRTPGASCTRVTAGRGARFGSSGRSGPTSQGRGFPSRGDLGGGSDHAAFARWGSRSAASSRARTSSSRPSWPSASVAGGPVVRLVLPQVVRHGREHRLRHPRAAGRRGRGRRRAPRGLAPVRENYFGERVAERYDESSGEMFDPAVVGATVDFLAELAATAPHSSSGSARAGSRCPSRSAASACRGSISRRRWSRNCARSPARRRSRVTIGDFATTRVDGTFSLAYLVYNTIGNLTTQDEQAACFENVAAHLEPGGCFVIELGVPRLRTLPPGQRFQVFDFGRDARRDRRVRRREPGARLPSLLARRRRVAARCRCRSATVTPAELDLMARLAGMTLRERWSGWQREPFTSESTKHVSVWQKPA